MSGEYFENDQNNALGRLAAQLPAPEFTYSSKPIGFGNAFRVIDPTIPREADQAVQAEGFMFTDGTAVIKDLSGVMTVFPTMLILTEQMAWADIDWFHCGDDPA